MLLLLSITKQLEESWDENDLHCHYTEVIINQSETSQGQRRTSGIKVGGIAELGNYVYRGCAPTSATRDLQIDSIFQRFGPRVVVYVARVRLINMMIPIQERISKRSVLSSYLCVTIRAVCTAYAVFPDWQKCPARKMRLCCRPVPTIF
jgi:hypothetical protein